MGGAKRYPSIAFFGDDEFRRLTPSYVLVRGREYEVLGERDDCYILSGFDKGFSKTRFEVVYGGPGLLLIA
jgi:hypothetical protein